MRNTFAYFTPGQLAKIHGINKRTLHYYDEMGIFSPACKGENGYRYYRFEQSMELENILSLRELGMSIEEIRNYMKRPGPEAFCAIASDKMEEIDQSIKRLKQLKTALRQKSGDLARCKEVYHGKIELVERLEQPLLLTPLDLSFETRETLADRSADILEHLKEAWCLSSYRKNCGSYLSLDRVRSGSFQNYDGVFSEVDANRKGLYRKPAGRYLRGFCVGDWNRIRDVYEALLEFADRQDIELSGYAFERGLNEFAITEEAEYITQIEIRAKTADETE